MRDLCDHVWYYLTRNGTKESVQKLQAELVRPLPGREIVSDALVETERAQFAKIFGSGPLKGPPQGQAPPKPSGV